LKLAGFHVQAEVRTSKGRIDAILQYDNRTYLFEFKLDQNAQIALQQIEQKEYFKKYLQQPNPHKIYLVAINFSSEKKEITDFSIQSY
ncbi:MAG: PD-(D/E)XK nuclease domain-containing protein, partial [Raineya sp.]|nr:PD-(D/E)XK nuclease domain-containing protein [Raineya sp.]